MFTHTLTRVTQATGLIVYIEAHRRRVKELRCTARRVK